MKTKNKFLILFLVIACFGIIIIILLKSGDTFLKSDEPEIINILNEKEQINVNITKTQNYLNAIELQKISQTITETTIPAIISITATQNNSTHSDDTYYYDEPRPEGLYNDKYLGSGVIISKNGYIITVAHLIQNAEQVSIILNDESIYDAEIIGTNETYDIAILKINTKENLPVAYLGNSDEVKTGDFGFAIGNPFGLSGTVTFGIVSAVDRVIESSPDNYYIQTDAEINTGNSGGAFVNIKGQVVGINKSIFSYGLGNNIGISFAIPINIAKKVAMSIIKAEPLQKPFLGMMFKEDIISTQTNILRSKEGLKIISVYEDSPASKNNIKENDVILSMNGLSIQRRADYDKILFSKDIGDSITLSIKRGENILTKKLTLITNPDYQKYNSSNFLGLVVDRPDKKYRNIIIPKSIKKGVVLVGIERHSPSKDIGIKEGDVIIQIDENTVDSLDEYIRITEEFKRHTKARFMIIVKRYLSNKKEIIKKTFYIENK
jgi:serine protease Do